MRVEGTITSQVSKTRKASYIAPVVEPSTTGALGGNAARFIRVPEDEEPGKSGARRSANEGALDNICLTAGIGLPGQVRHRAWFPDTIMHCYPGTARCRTETR